MGSNGNHRQNQLSHAYLHIIQLQWTPMGYNGKLVYALGISDKRDFGPPSTTLDFGTIKSYVFTGLLGRTLTLDKYGRVAAAH